MTSASTERHGAAGDGVAAVVHATQAMRGRLDALLESAHAAARSYDELGARCAGLERECAECHAAVHGLRRERDEAQEALDELRVAYEALLGQYEGDQKALGEVSRERDALRGELAQTAEQLEKLLRTLRD